MSEDKNSTGIILPWESAAIRGDEMPDGLEYPDQVLFLALRMLYAQKRMGIIDRDAAIIEKKKLLDEYRVYQYRAELEKGWVEDIKRTEAARAEFRKEPSVESGWRLLNTLEGRKYNA